jgi:hypothetical protein
MTCQRIFERFLATDITLLDDLVRRAADPCNREHADVEPRLLTGSFQRKKTVLPSIGFAHANR